MTTSVPATPPGAIESLLGWVLGQSSIIIAALVFLAALCWAWYATGSSHVIRARLWRFVFGKRDLGTDVVDEYLKERDQVMHFRVVTGLKQVGTRRAAECLVRWLRKFDIDSDMVAAAGMFFEFDPPKLRDKIPGLGIQAGFTVVSTLFALIAGVAVVLGATLPPVIRVIKTDHWYAVSRENIYAFKVPPAKDKGFRYDQCNAPQAVASATHYPVEDVEVLCKAIESEEPALQEALVGQRVIATVVLAFAAVLARLLWQVQSQIEAARRLRQLIEGRRKVSSRP